MSYTPLQYSLLDSGNTTTTPLSGSSTYTGTSLQEFMYPHIVVSVATDQIGELIIQFSNDGTNWDSTLTIPYDPDVINQPNPIYKMGRYHRVVFENTSTSAQTYLRLYTYIGIATNLTANLNNTISQTFPAMATRPTDYHHEVALGIRENQMTWHKWGYNKDVDTGGEEVIASFGGTFAIMTSSDTLDIVSDDANDTLLGTGARTIQLIGIDGNGYFQTEDIEMNGTTAVTSTLSWLGINRIRILTTGSNNVNVGTITVTDTSGTYGTQAQVPSGEGVTQQAIFHVQEDRKLPTNFLFCNIRKLSGGGAPFVTVRGWKYTRSNDSYYEVFRYDIDTSVENSFTLNPFEPFTYQSGDVVYFTAETDTNNTVVNFRFAGIEHKII